MITVNGQPTKVPAGTTLATLVASLTAASPGVASWGAVSSGVASSGVAVAVNDEVVPRGAWPSTRLGDGDRVEVLTAVQGG